MRAKLLCLLVLFCWERPGFGANFWQQLGGPPDNAVFALTVNPLTGDLFTAFPTRLQPDGIIQAMSVFRSTNHGNFWEPLTNGLDGMRVLSLVTENTNTVFAAAHASGVLRSLDNGLTWQLVTNGLVNQTIFSVGLGASGNIFAGGLTGGVFRTSNEGTNWLAFNNGLTNLHVNVIKAGGGGQLFAGTEGGVFRTLDLGTNWIPASAGLTNLTINALTLSPAGDLIAGTAAGVFRSSNSGTNWSPITGALPNTDVRSVLVNNAGTLFAGTASGLFVQTNGTGTWTAANIGVTATNFAIGKLEADASGRLFAGTVLGVFRSADDGASWESLKNGLNIGVVKTVLNTVSGELFAGTLNASLYRSRDVGVTWDRISLSNVPATTHIFSLGVSPANRVFAGTYILSPVGLDTHIFRSDNGGDTWQAAHSGTQTAHVVGGFAFGSSGEMFATHGFNTNFNAGVMRSDDGGTNWTPTGLQTVVTYSVRRNASGHLFAGSESNGVYRSLDNGTNWTPVGPIAGNILALAINATGHVFAASSSGVNRGLYRSLDNGTNWVNLLPNTRCGSVAITMQGFVYAGAAEGTYCSTNNGANWTSLNSGMPTGMTVLSLVVGFDGHLYGGSGGAGVFRSTLPVNPVSNLIMGLSNGIPTLQLRGMPNQTYSLLSSTNLVDWTFASFLTTAPDGSSLPISVGAGGKTFYRSVWP